MKIHVLIIIICVFAVLHASAGVSSPGTCTATSSACSSGYTCVCIATDCQCIRAQGHPASQIRPDSFQNGKYRFPAELCLGPSGASGDEGCITGWASGNMSSQWVQSGSDIYYSSGKVGIGTSSPTSMLHIYSHPTTVAWPPLLYLDGLTTPAVGQTPSSDNSFVAVIKEGFSGTGAHGALYLESASQSGWPTLRVANKDASFVSDIGTSSTWMSGHGERGVTSYATINGERISGTLGYYDMEEDYDMPLSGLFEAGSVLIKAGISSGDLIMRAKGDRWSNFGYDPGDIIFQNSKGEQKARIWSEPTNSNKLYLSSGDNTPDISIDSTGQVTIPNLVEPSDIRLKDDISEIPDALDKVSGIEGVYFYWKDPRMGQSRQVGLIAQDVEKVLPELVKADSSGYETVDYNGMVPVLVEAVKELKEQNAELKEEVSTLKARVESLEDR